jgi:hypothetical protein
MTTSKTAPNNTTALRNWLWLVLAFASIVGSYAIFGRDVVEMKPQVKLNSEHRLQDAVTDKNVEDDIAEIKESIKNIQSLLESRMRNN